MRFRSLFVLARAIQPIVPVRSTVAILAWYHRAQTEFLPFAKQHRGGHAIRFLRRWRKGNWSPSRCYLICTADRRGASSVSSTSHKRVVIWIASIVVVSLQFTRVLSGSRLFSLHPMLSSELSWSLRSHRTISFLASPAVPLWSTQSVAFLACGILLTHRKQDDCTSLSGI